MSDRPWISYAERRPTEAGVYLWRVPSRACPGLVVVVQAHMRRRGAGYAEVLSPSFDYWDGYNVLVPDGLEWCETAEPANLAPYESSRPLPEGVSLASCPFCGKVPSFRASETSSLGGTAITPVPHRLNCWWAVCCDWVWTPRFNDPRSLAEAWNAMLAAPR